MASTSEFVSRDIYIYININRVYFSIVRPTIEMSGVIIYIFYIYIYFFFLGKSYPDHTIRDNYLRIWEKVHPGPRVVTSGYDF